MPDSFTRHPPDSMLRPPSRFTDSSAPAETQPAAFGRCGRRVRATSVAQAPESCGYAGPRLLRAGRCIRYAGAVRLRSHSHFVVPFLPSFPIHLSVRPITEWRERDAVLFCFGRFGLLCRSSFRLLSDIEFPFASLLSLSAASARNELKRGFVPVRLGSDGSRHRRFRLLFIASSSTVFPSSSPYTTPAITGGGQERNAVLSLFRWDGFRFRGLHCNSGKRAALAGFREGGRKGKPMPPLSLFSGYTSSGRIGRDEKRYIQFKSRPSDRRHAYF